MEALGLSVPGDVSVVAHDDELPALRASASPFVQQFLNGEADGPVRFHYPSRPWADVLGG